MPCEITRAMAHSIRSGTASRLQEHLLLTFLRGRGLSLPWAQNTREDE